MNLLELEDLITFETINADPRYHINMKVIEPNHAIQWVAHGYFATGGAHSPIRSWLHSDDETMLTEVTREGSRFEMAEELVVNAIKSGAVRCVYILPDRTNGREHAYKLSAVKPEQFAGMSLSHDWDAGFGISFAETDTELDLNTDVTSLPAGMWFLWDEIAALRPDYTIPAAIETPPVVASPRPHYSESIPVRDRRGKPAKPWGDLMAGMLQKAADRGFPEAFTLTNKVVGGWLIDAHRELNVSPVPTLEKAGRDAKALLLALKALLLALKAMVDDGAFEASAKGVSENTEGASE